MTLYNEEANIERCLDSIAPYLDYFCIGVDEKTTDNTKQKVLDYFEGNTVGKVFDSPWNGFADARNQCLDQADSSACDFYLYLDADHTLTVTNNEWTSKLSTDMDAYTLSDRATWLTFKNKRALKILFEGDLLLFNQYGAILINPEKCPKTNIKEARALLDWVLSEVGQTEIGNYKIR